MSFLCISQKNDYLCNIRAENEMKDYSDKMTTAKEIIEYMESLRNEEQRGNLMRFFKTLKVR